MYILKLLIIFSTPILCKKNYKRKDDKLLLDPIEIIDLISAEKMKTDLPSAGAHNKRMDIFYDGESDPGIDSDDQSTTERECRDEETLRARKVWSRWSKWSECSVTCGRGAIVRRRACAAGRCARGEREEQRRPCARAPCAAASLAADQRDAD